MFLKPPLQLFIFILIISVLNSCSTSRKIKLKKDITAALNQKLFANHFAGLLIYDPIKGDTILKQNHQKYFTPASNTKIFTLYASLQLLPDSIPTLKYIDKDNTVYVEGTGDPTQLHPYFKDSTLVHFLKRSDSIFLNTTNFHEEKYGPGWAWEDYDGYYSPERNGLPLYGNVAIIHRLEDSMVVIPDHFKDSVIQVMYPVHRKEKNNTFFFNPSRNDTLEVPFIVDSTLTKNLLENAIEKQIHLISKMPEGDKKILYGAISDSVYTRMMQESDNFLAEQLLILASSTLSDTLNSAIVRNHLLQNQLSELKNPPRWVDGSGLSRYNLFTPESLVFILHRMFTEVPRKRLFSIFPSGGDSGTLEDWYGGNPHPYIYAKSGSLGNNYCLSGYLLTKSGKTVIFSFMNNHFRQPSSEIKSQMQLIFEQIRDKY